ncbi:hypothetical protein Tco_0761825 [Tanacetum coccineum]
MAAGEVPQTLEYKGGHLNVAPVLEVENFTNWKKRFMCHIIAGQRKPEGQYTVDERKAANLDQRLKSLIMSYLPDDQMNSVINYLTVKSTWDDLILYHEGPSDVKESRVMDLKLCYNTFKFKKDSPDDEEDTRSSHEYLNDLEEEYQARALLAKSKIFFKNAVPSYQLPFQPKLLHSSEHKPEPRRTKDFEAKYKKVKAKLALLSSSASAPSSSSGKNKILIAEMYDLEEEEVSSDDNEVTEVKALMALTNEERVYVGKESANNGEWVKISIQKESMTTIMPEDPYLTEMAAYQVQPSPDYIPILLEPRGSTITPVYILGPEEPQSPPHWTLFLSRCTLSTYHRENTQSGAATTCCASPTADSPGYVPESDLEEEPEEDDEDPEEDLYNTLCFRVIDDVDKSAMYLL